jgi:hypothetical protein
MNPNRFPVDRTDPCSIAEQRHHDKTLRKKVRALIRADLQRRAITGEPSPFRRCTQP